MTSLGWYVSWTYHPSILKLVEVVHLENVSLHLVTELMSGCDLQDAIDGGVYSAEMSEKNVRLITVQFAAAIAHLHQAPSMAHRDIKPQNVLCRWRTNPMKAVPSNSLTLASVPNSAAAQRSLASLFMLAPWTTSRQSSPGSCAR